MAKKTKAVKMADIAKALEVSTVTVSKALSDQSGVSEELRARIKALAEEMGYKPVVAVRSGTANKSYNIGVLISERYLDFYESFYWKIYQEITNCAIQRGCFTMLEVISSDMENTLMLPKLITEGKAEGIIIVGKPGNSYATMLKQNIKQPIMFLDFYESDVSSDSIISDGFYGMYLMTNYLIDHGHKDIAYVGTLLATESITDRYLGYQKALLEHGIVPKDDRLVNDRDLKSGITNPNGSFKLPAELPTAFVCNCDARAADVVRLLRERGYRVPEDISVVGFDNYLSPSSCDVGITTYEVDIREMARLAISNLVKKIAGESYKKGLRIVEGHLVEKESVRAI